jgi:hypothetical protein
MGELLVASPQTNHLAHGTGIRPGYSIVLRRLHSSLSGTRLPTRLELSLLHTKISPSEDILSGKNHRALSTGVLHYMSISNSSFISPEGEPARPTK